uniref:RING-type domain-containing protein n=1 Tax=Clytia hemisphaerica TaxID=252671 RepID=A0A7M5V9W7_9CNID
MAASRDHDNNNMNGYSSSSSEEDENIGYHFELVENDFQCIICHYVIRGFTELPCGHAGCKFCIEEWEKRKVACCECQKTYDRAKVNIAKYFLKAVKPFVPRCREHHSLAFSKIKPLRSVNEKFIMHASVTLL